MFSKRQKAEEVIAQKNLETEKQFDAAIDAAGKIEDPAQKVLTLVKISEDISTHIKNEDGLIEGAANRSRNKAILSGTGGAIAAGTVAAILLGPIGWVGVPVMGGVYVAGRAVSSKRKKSVEKNLERSSLGHIERMENKADVVSDMTGETVSKNVKELSKSPEYKHILTLPGIKDKFADAAQKHLSIDPPPAPPAVEVKKQEPRKPVDSKPTYDDRIKKRL